MKKIFEPILAVIALVLVSVVALLRLFITICAGILGMAFALFVILSPLLLVGFIFWVVFE